MTRTGLVLGAGGILGSAWMTGALPAVQERIGRPLGELDLVLGTSAGAVLGAALRCGMGVDELLAHQHGTTYRACPTCAPSSARPATAVRRSRCRGSGRPGSSPARSRTPARVNPVIAASALLPAGRGRLGSLIRMVTALQARLGVTGDGWVPGAPLWVVAVDYRLRSPDRVRPPGRPAVDGRGGRAGLVLDPGLVHAAGDRRAPLRRRRGRVVDVAGAARAAGRAAAGRGVRARAAGQPRVRPAARPDRGRRAGCAVPAHALAGRRGAGRAGGGRAGHAC